MLRDRVQRSDETSWPACRIGPKLRLSPEQETRVAELVRQGPELAVHGVARQRRADLSRLIEVKFGVRLAERSVGDLLRRLEFRRLYVRPRHPGHDAAAQASFRSRSTSL